MTNTAKGGMIGGGSGAALGAIIGGVVGHGKGAAIGAAVGAAVGTGAGVLIGKKMDKAAAQAEQIEGAQVEQVTDTVPEDGEDLQRQEMQQPKNADGRVGKRAAQHGF